MFGNHFALSDSKVEVADRARESTYDVVVIGGIGWADRRRIARTCREEGAGRRGAGTARRLCGGDPCGRVHLRSRRPTSSGCEEAETLSG